MFIYKCMRHLLRTLLEVGEKTRDFLVLEEYIAGGGGLTLNICRKSVIRVTIGDSTVLVGFSWGSREKWSFHPEGQDSLGLS